MKQPTVDISPLGGSMRIGSKRFYTYGWGEDPAAQILEDVAAYDAGESFKSIGDRRGLDRKVVRNVFAACGVKRRRTR